MIVEAETGVISNHMQENTVRFFENDVVIHTAVISSYNEG